MSVYLGIPFYGGAGAEFVSSLLKTHAALHLSGMGVEVDMHTNCSVLPKARNEIVARFIASGFDRLVFLDTDMSWVTTDIFALIMSEHPVCAIDYRKKTDEIDFVSALTGREKEGWSQAHYTGAGLMCISRAAILGLQVAHPETKYTNESGQTVYALFDFLLQDGRYCGEDYIFCKRWTDLNGEIAVLTGADTGHTGTKTYRGNQC